MANYREIRVRPVVRYIVTDYQRDDDSLQPPQSQAYGEFDNVGAANCVGQALATATPGAIFESARMLRIHWLRGPGEPQQNIRWELEDPDAPQPV